MKADDRWVLLANALDETNLRNWLVDSFAGKIEKYEYNYGYINIYLRNFAPTKSVQLDVTYRSMYPEVVTGGTIRAYDYYNPEVEGIANPVGITVNK